ncbi:MAG: hypothetical protein KDA28_15475, partial [Phycisphaerales bacterium]|nr:hypothetical protein [Phycisphaerales bacterium]
PDDPNANDPWSDLVLMFSALADPSKASRALDAQLERPVEAGNSHAFMAQWCTLLDRCGTIDATITADHPYVAVFTRDGRRTRVVYSYESQPIVVRFSDGIEFDVTPGLSWRTDPQTSGE